MQQVNYNGYIRINKTKARNLFMKGKSIIVVPCKLAPRSTTIATLTPKEGECSEKDFENAVNACTYYNCNAETGRTLFFYIVDENYAKKYRLTATFEKSYNIQNVLTGKTIVVNKQELVDKVRKGEVEVVGYMIDPMKNELTSYR